MNISTQAVAAAIIALMPPAKPIEIKQERMVATLAPNPLYFTIDGRPARTTAWVDHSPYIVDWNGSELRRIDWPGEEGKGPNGNGNGRGGWFKRGGNGDGNDDEQGPPKLPPNGFWGCVIAIVVFIVFWGSLYLLWRWFR